MKMSTLLIAIVIALHCAALGSLFFIQGCGTTSRTGTPPAETMPVMPPTVKESATYPEQRAPKKAPAVQVESKDVRKTVETTEYIVRSGDTLGGIAKQYGVSQSEIVKLNKIADANKVRIGQKLILPGHLKIKAPPAKAAKPAEQVKTASVLPAEAAPVPAGGEYVVVKGDSLSKIAKQHGTKISALREANQRQNDKLKIGQKLKIPEAGSASDAPAAAAVPASPAVPAQSPAPSPAVEPFVPAAPAASAPVPVKPALETPAVTPAPAATPLPVADSGITHIVQPNDDINSVAKLYAVTADEIAELNKLGDNRTLKVGQRLTIP